MPLTRYDLTLRLGTGSLRIRTWCIDRGEARRQALTAADALNQAGTTVQRITASSAETGEIVVDQAPPPPRRRGVPLVGGAAPRRGTPAEPGDPQQNP